MAWFAANGWPLHGFVAPAWLMSEATWQALDTLPLRYTTTLRHFYLLHPSRSILAPCLTYSVQTGPRRLASRYYVHWLAHHHAHAPLLRLGLHPANAAYPDVVRHWQDLLAACLETRVPVTKNGFAQVADGQAGRAPDAVAAGPVLRAPRPGAVGRQFAAGTMAASRPSIETLTSPTFGANHSVAFLSASIENGSALKFVRRTDRFIRQACP